MSYTVSAKSIIGITLNEKDTVKSVLQNVAIILSTWQHSVPHYRKFGLAIDFIDKPITVARPMIIASVKEAIEEYEPRATIKSVTFEANEATLGKLVPVLEVDVNDE